MRNGRFADAFTVLNIDREWLANSSEALAERHRSNRRKISVKHAPQNTHRSIFVWPNYCSLDSSRGVACGRADSATGGCLERNLDARNVGRGRHAA